jgi:hypothetical protein
VENPPPLPDSPHLANNSRDVKEQRISQRETRCHSTIIRQPATAGHFFLASFVKGDENRSEQIRLMAIGARFKIEGPDTFVFSTFVFSDTFVFSLCFLCAHDDPGWDAKCVKDEYAARISR